MNIGSLFKALVAVAESDAASILPEVAAAATSVAGNQSPANLAAAGAQLLSAALPLAPKIEQDEIQTLADVVALQASAALAKVPAAVTPAAAAAAAIAG